MSDDPKKNPTQETPKLPQDQAQNRERGRLNQSVDFAAREKDAAVYQMKRNPSKAPPKPK